jgi:hypothetical protein
MAGILFASKPLSTLHQAEQFIILVKFRLPLQEPAEFLFKAPST